MVWEIFEENCEWCEDFYIGFVKDVFLESYNCIVVGEYFVR